MWALPVKLQLKVHCYLHLHKNYLLNKCSIVVEEGPARKKSSKKSVAAAATPESSTSFGLTTIGHSADVLDMPVDPNEPTYCLCHQVSYGEMIGCDNPDVSFPFTKLIVCQLFLINNYIPSVSVPNRMVSFCLRQSNDQTQRQMVLPEMFCRSEKEMKRTEIQLFMPLSFCSRKEIPMPLSVSKIYIWCYVKNGAIY